MFDNKTHLLCLMCGALKCMSDVQCSETYKICSNKFLVCTVLLTNSERLEVILRLVLTVLLLYPISY